MQVKTIEWLEDKLRIIDQTRLPNELVYIDINTYQELAEAITSLKIRGAPAIGIAAGFGVVLAVKNIPSGKRDLFFEEIDNAVNCLKATRPTAVNLSWALNRVRSIVGRNTNRLVSEISKLVTEEALAILHEDQQMCEKIGRNGAQLLPRSATVLTHCNAGSLATGGIGTALGIIYSAVEMGKKVKVYVDETRPLLQGARLTAWELSQADIDVTLICDNTAAYVMQQGLVDCVLVGADRIAQNGDVANKVGTYNLAVLARQHNLPFYVAAPYSTVDCSLENGSNIPIEERDAEEIVKVQGKSIAPSNIKVYNPAFDVTPNEYITAIITEKQVTTSPYSENLKIYKKTS